MQKTMCIKDISIPNRGPTLRTLQMLAHCSPPLYLHVSAFGRHAFRRLHFRRLLYFHPIDHNFQSIIRICDCIQHFEHHNLALSWKTIIFKNNS